MASEPDPKPFLEDYPIFHLPVDNEDAAAIRQQQGAHARALHHRSYPDNQSTPWQPLSTPAHGHRTDDSMSVCGSAEGTTCEALPETCRPGGDGLDAGMIASTKPLSCPDVDCDSGSPPEVWEVHNSDCDQLASRTEENKVRRSPEARCTSGHTSQACESSDQLPLSSSDTAEEQEEGAHCGLCKR